MYRRIFPNGRVLQHDRLQHESFLSDNDVVERVLAEVKELLRTTEMLQQWRGEAQG